MRKLLALIPMLLLLFAPTAGAAERPDIIFILSDDQDRRSLEAMPQTRKLFPLRFPNHILTTPVCCPSRETFLTGQYAHNHGVRANSPALGLLPDDQPFGGWWAAGSREANLGRWLQREGYYTALIGKYLNGFGPDTPIPAGWDYFAGALRDEEKGYFNYRLNENGVLRSYGESPGEYSTTVLTSHVLKALRAARAVRKPAFIYFAPMTPHGGTTSSRLPAMNPEPHPQDRGIYAKRFRNPTLLEQWGSFNERDISDKPQYLQQSVPKPLDRTKIKQFTWIARSRWESLYSLDRQIVRIVGEAEKNGAEPYYFYTTDNGYLLGQHRLKGKFVPYDESTRFPLLVRGPNLARQDNPAMIANIDFAPTVLDLAKAEATKIQDGRSLLPLIEEGGTWSREILLEGFPRAAENPAVPYDPYLAIRTEQDIFISYSSDGIWPRQTNGVEEYYDLSLDPWQESNLIFSDQHQARINYLRSKLNSLQGCIGPAC